MTVAPPAAPLNHDTAAAALAPVILDVISTPHRGAQSQNRLIRASSLLRQQT